ncbi:cobyric acid synthase [Vibrio sp. CK2-1]|uniref:cobyric acid synthase n=1 Tax=Vibrio sp. CK2-1 TaxID=2912249 RepID=UPI001F01B39F|nr:cobyric acid synthase [Vibrio sp. CK2-1]MCF7353441.1 cobyric acid synthase [Vibrio sp. CK2-1]
MLEPIQALMVQGTTSDAGKSVLVAGLCRVLMRKGVSVAPFKSQNMALNSAVTKDGGEIGRAQALQAFACGVEPSVHMNPILLKPNTDMKAQIIVQGKALPTEATLGNISYKNYTMPYVLDSFEQLNQKFDCVLIEGAGSPAEINLRENDIANMGFAEEADVPVIIVADIDRGGVFAHLYGTLALLSQSEQDRVMGFVINRFRGDIELLNPGLDWLEQKTGKPVIGVLPYLHGLELDAEDAVDSQQTKNEQTKLTVFVPVFPRMSNHTDFDMFKHHPEIDFQFRYQGQSLTGADLVILPGSKSVRADLAFLQQQGWHKDIEKHLRYGGKLIGICGGYQMLGKTIADPDGIEGPAGIADGLGYLELTTELKPHKSLTQVTGTLSLVAGKVASIIGYEIHAGETLVDLQQPISINTVSHDKKYDGALSDDGMIFGTYCHGIFDSPQAFEHILEWAGVSDLQQINSREQQQIKSLDRLADSIEQDLNLALLWPELFSR